MDNKLILLLALGAAAYFFGAGGGGGSNKYGYPRAGEYFGHVGIFERNGYGHSGER